jgi:acyl-CoA thioester hydrolase
VSTGAATPHRSAPHRYPVRVQWEDTDAAGIVYYANYLRFIERARSDLLLQHGIDQRGIMASDDGVAFAVRSCSTEYLQPARLHEELTVTTGLVELRGASVTLAQDVWRGDDLLVRAEVRLACIDKSGRARRVPPAVAAILATLSPNLSR